MIGVGLLFAIRLSFFMKDEAECLSWVSDILSENEEYGHERVRWVKSICEYCCSY
jgi:hypothetical protein